MGVGAARKSAVESRPPWEDDPSDPGPPPLDDAVASDIVVSPRDRAPRLAAPSHATDRRPLERAGEGRPREGSPGEPSPGGAPRASAPADTAAALPSVDETAEGTRWATLVATLIERGAVAALVRELAWQAQCECFEHGEAQGRVVLRVERETLRNPSHIERLRKVLVEALKVEVALEVQAGAVHDTPARRDAAARARAQREAELAIHNDPLVQQWLQQFPTARIVPGSIKPL